MSIRNPYKSICYVIGCLIVVLAGLLVFYFRATSTVTFDTKGGTIYRSLEVKLNTSVAQPADPVMPGYTFEGWYIEGENEEYDFSRKVMEDTTIVAKWKPII